MCEHHNFAAKVSVARLEDPGKRPGFMAEITVRCTECDTPFQFLGLEPGCDTQGARVSIDGLEACIAIVPQGEAPNPLDRLLFNIKGRGNPPPLQS